mgnify:CR=1 FL=1
MEKRLLNIEEASEYLGIPRGSLYKMSWQKRLPFVVKVGRALRFDKIKMDEWIEENTEEVIKFSPLRKN